MENFTDQLVTMRDVYSNEYYKSESSYPVQVLKGISFSANKGQAWSIFGNSIFEVKLLTEIMAGARAYQKGQCSLSGFGMMRRKRTVLSHTFYIGSTNMLFGNMVVLEYLMFVTTKSSTDTLTRQQQILDKLVAVGLDYVALTPIELLTPQEKAAVTLFCATFSQSQLYIINLPRLIYDVDLIKALAKISELIRNDGKTLIFSTECLELAQAISTCILVIQSGSVSYCGELVDFLERYDKVIYTVECEDAITMLAGLVDALPMYTCCIDSLKQNTIEVFDYTGSDLASDFYGVFSKIGIIPQAVSHNCLNLRNAYRGQLRGNDL